MPGGKGDANEATQSQFQFCIIKILLDLALKNFFLIFF